MRTPRYSTAAIVCPVSSADRRLAAGRHGGARHPHSTSTSWCTGRSRTTTTSSIGGRAGGTSTSKGAWSGIVRTADAARRAVGPQRAVAGCRAGRSFGAVQGGCRPPAAGAHRDQGHFAAGPSLDLDRGVPAGGVQEPGGGVAGGQARHPARRRLRGRQRLQRSRSAGSAPVTWSQSRCRSLRIRYDVSWPASTAASPRQSAGDGFLRLGPPHVASRYVAGVGWLAKCRRDFIHRFHRVDPPLPPPVSHTKGGVG